MRQRERPYDPSVAPGREDQSAARARSTLESSPATGDHDPDADPAAALLLRVEPAGTELRLDQAIGHNGQDGVTEGQAAHREGLLRLRTAALSVGSEAHLNFSKTAATDSRPPLTELRLSADAFSDREGESAPQAACLLPVGGEDVTHTQEEN